MGASTIVARLAAGTIKAATPAELRTLLDVPTNSEAILDAIVDAKGDLIAGTAADTVARLAAGTDFLDVLTSDASTASGLRWGYKRSALRRSGSLFESIPRMSLANITALTSQRLFMQAIDLPSGLSIDSISFMSATTALGTGVHQLFGLYDSSRALLRGSADDGATAWAQNTVKTLTLTSAFVTTYSGLHYLGILVDATTVPTLQGASTTSASNAVAPILAGNSTATITALPDPAAAITAAAAQLWATVN